MPIAVYPDEVYMFHREVTIDLRPFSSWDVIGLADTQVNEAVQLMKCYLPGPMICKLSPVDERKELCLDLKLGLAAALQCVTLEHPCVTHKVKLTTPIAPKRAYILLNTVNSDGTYVYRETVSHAPQVVSELPKRIHIIERRSNDQA